MPLYPPHHPRVVTALGLLAGLGLVLACGAVTISFSRVWVAADYPGAVRVSDHSIYKTYPHLHLRRDTSYQTTDLFPEVYNWYSSGFALGPEVRAQSACIVMSKSRTTWLALESAMDVTVCETPRGRMIFVMRSFTVRYRK